MVKCLYDIIKEHWPVVRRPSLEAIQESPPHPAASDVYQHFHPSDDLAAALGVPLMAMPVEPLHDSQLPPDGQVYDPVPSESQQDASEDPVPKALFQEDREGEVPVEPAGSSSQGLLAQDVNETIEIPDTYQDSLDLSALDVGVEETRQHFSNLRLASEAVEPLPEPPLAMPEETSAVVQDKGTLAIPEESLPSTKDHNDSAVGMKGGCSSESISSTEVEQTPPPPASSAEETMEPPLPMRVKPLPEDEKYKVTPTELADVQEKIRAIKLLILLIQMHILF